MIFADYKEICGDGKSTTVQFKVQIPDNDVEFINQNLNGFRIQGGFTELKLKIGDKSYISALRVASRSPYLNDILFVNILNDGDTEFVPSDDGPKCDCSETKEDIISVPIVVQKRNGQTMTFMVNEYDTIRSIFSRFAGEELDKQICFGDSVLIPTPVELFDKLIKEHNDGINSEQAPF